MGPSWIIQKEKSPKIPQIHQRMINPRKTLTKKRTNAKKFAGSVNPKNIPLNIYIGINRNIRFPIIIPISVAK